MKDYAIRKATKEDVPALFDLIKELAVFEKAVREVETSKEDLLRDGFGERPLFGAYVAEQGGEVVGAAFYYWRYSTWKGKMLYLEDLIVNEAHRRRGLGDRLFEQMVRVATENDANGISLQVLDWNEDAIEF
ncbi:MAG: GNAT family N-acetyltransferase, partial [Catalinimonas sp.]